MIFPELPKRYKWMQTAPELAENRDPVLAEAQAIVGPYTAKAPLRGSTDLTMDEWLAQRGYALGPAAASRENTEKESINWLAQDAWEFYALCIGMLCWIIFWYGVHTGAW